jgi:hypothetical protein
VPRCRHRLTKYSGFGGPFRQAAASPIAALACNRPGRGDKSGRAPVAASHRASGRAALSRVVTLRCRIEPYLDQGDALRAPRAGASARPPALGRPRPSARRPSRPVSADQPGSYSATGAARCRLPRRFKCPAPGRRVEVAPCGRVACDRLRRTSTRCPLAEYRRLSRKTGEKQDSARTSSWALARASREVCGWRGLAPCSVWRGGLVRASHRFKQLLYEANERSACDSQCDS